MITQTSPNHWGSIKAIYIEGIATRNATFESIENVTTYEKWIAGKIKDSCMVYKEGVEIKGWATLSPVSSRCVYAGVAEVSVYVSKNSAGKGIGAALMGALIEYAENNKIWTLQAGIFPENKASIALHQKYGFREVGRREKIGKMNGVWRDTLLFEKRSLNFQDEK